MADAKDYSGQKFNYLTALYYTGKINKNKSRIWMFQCDCGKIIEKTIAQVRAGNVRSCGCVSKTYHKIDWTKYKFNKLTPLEATDKYYKSSYRKIWKFKCDCGNICEFPIDFVSRGMIISCGCVKRENGNKGKKRDKQIKDLTNQKFNKLTALYFVSLNEQNHPIWHFKCDCGNEIDLISSCVTRKYQSKKSCGCDLKTTSKDFTNQKFNMLTMLYPTKKRCGSAIVWHCRCDCGNECDISGTSVSLGNTKSCGCLKGKYFEEMSIAHDIYTGYCIRELKLFNVDLTISFEDFLILTQDKCYYCGRLPHRVATKQYGNYEFIYNGIDRKDNTLPHTIENSVTCCWDCNKMKADSSIDDFINHIKLIMQNFKGK